ncbi:TSUP family transporter [Streptomyces sp. HU2014]|uniref:Probable membrane transporter protein n=1 Tax=Streptomyces albireticuli TaxID=1940 RepID=A0A1Z2L7G7_9ACTN|nr:MULTISPECIES: TSUP family transporter [Streptomyces]ARZ70256.1 membrane protein [Streptomyces albireticuli]UQI43798.1 TSUP family transporter [Streptomyces sp. HU2014]
MVHDISLTTLLLLCLAAAAAGWIDAVVGGGGLLQLPALLVALPHVPAAHVLGTNKAVAICGTSAAAVSYVRGARLDLRTAVRIGLAALGGSLAGAFFAAGIDSAVLRPLIMGVLLAVLAFLLLRPAFGTAGEPAAPVTRRRVLAAILVAGLGIGFYDGLIGPGTGTFLVIALAGILHMDLVAASGTAKIVNVCTNVGALVTFSLHGSVLWQLAAPMALCNLTGGAFGARMALKRGSGFVRGVLVVVVVSLVCKLGYDQWGG